MVNVLQEIVLLNLIEAIMTVYIVIDFRKYGKLQVLFALLCSLFVIYVYPIMIPLPVLPQILMLLVNAYVLSKIFELDFKFCLKRIAILYFGITLVCEAGFFAITKSIFNVNPFVESSNINRFLYGIPIRIIELILILFYKKVSDIYEKNETLVLWSSKKGRKERNN